MQEDRPPSHYHSPVVKWPVNSVELQQLFVGWSTEVDHRSIAARSECCRETDLWSRSAWSLTPASYELHWLPVKQRVTFKLCTLMHLIHTGCCPSCMSELVTSTSSIASRSRLCSASSRRCEQPATRLKLGEWSYAFAGPAAWNSLPTSLHEITNHKAFKHELKNCTSII